MMLTRRSLYIGLLSGLLLSAVLSYNACTNIKFETVHGTATVGNPMAPISNEILFAVCGVITRCNSQVNMGQCQAGILSASGFAAALGLSSSYSTYSTIIQGEQSGVLVGNSLQASNCSTSISSLSCSNSSVVNSYNSALSNPFMNAAVVIPPLGSCSQVFSAPLQYACSQGRVAAVGQPVSIVPATGSGPGFSVTPGLPSGLTINSQTGVISGTPTAATGPTKYTVTAGYSSAVINLQTVQGYVVNDLGDETDANPGDGKCETATGNGICTLRAAITEANADGAGTWNIVVPEGTISVGSSLLAGNNINIFGVCRDSSIIDGGGGAYDAVDMSAVASLSVQNLTIQNAGDAGIGTGYNNSVNLAATNVRFENNNGGGVGWGWNNTTAVFTNCIFEGNTGAAAAWISRTNGSATFSGCVFDNNKAGAVFIPNTASTVNIVNSTFYNNSGGSAIYINDPGPTVSIKNSTIANNSATSGSVGGTAGGIFIWGTVTIENTIIANNTATVSGSSSNCFNNVNAISNGGNLVWPNDPNCGFTNSADIAPADPMFGSFQDNGGPTFTLSLLLGSPAIDNAVISGCPAFDQRGYSRLTDGKCDAGAYEFQP